MVHIHVYTQQKHWLDHTCIILYLYHNCYIVFATFPHSDYGYARPGEDLSGLCVRDPDVELDDPCVDEDTTTYNKSTG